jgi:hypothetical protein
MTEDQWLACMDPVPMLEFISGRASGRKLRLFSVACIRRVQRFLLTADSLGVIDLAEQLADDPSTTVDEEAVDSLLAAASIVGGIVPDDPDACVPIDFRADAVCDAILHAVADPEDFNRTGASHSLRAAERAVDALRHAGEEIDSEPRFQAGLLRDIFGNPFRPVSLEFRWLTSNVVKLANTIYDNRDTARLPLLADALQDAGCNDETILSHCRSVGPHVRGCWVVDLLLKKV